MRKIMLTAVAAITLSFAGLANAAAVSKTLKQTVDRSFQGLKAHDGAAAYKGDRLQISSNGKSATANIQAFGHSPGGPVRPIVQPAGWYTVKSGTFLKNVKSGTWKKSGKWETLYYAQ